MRDAHQASAQPGPGARSDAKALLVSRRRTKCLVSRSGEVKACQ
jgi:hypothetical protein